MKVLDNLKLLEEKELLGFITSDLLSDTAELTPEEVLNLYSNDMKKLYNILPIETYEFLKKYFENNKKVPATIELTECYNALKNCGIATFEARDLKEIDLMLDIKYGRVEGYPEEEIEEEKEFHDVELDDEFAEKLLKFLNENISLVDNDIKMKELVLKTIEEKSSMSLKELESILKSEGFQVENLFCFLENKLPYGTIVAYGDGEEIHIAHNTHELDLDNLNN